jgi:hypothetical protein
MTETLSRNRREPRMDTNKREVRAAQANLAAKRRKSRKRDTRQGEKDDSPRREIFQVGRRLQVRLGLPCPPIR